MHNAQFNVVDIIAGVLILAGTLNGLRRGLAAEIASAISMVIAFLVGLLMYRPCGKLLAAHTTVNEDVARSLAFVTLVIVSFVVLLLLRLLVEKALTLTVSNKPLDHFGGLLAGFCKTAALVSIVILGIAMWGNDRLCRACGRESAVGRVLVRAWPEFRESVKHIRNDVMKD